MERRDGVRQVYDASYQRLVVQLLGVCGDRAEAEDAVQEAFIKAIGLGSGFARLDNPEAWLRTVAVNHVKNRWRHLGVVRRARIPTPGPSMVRELSPDHVVVVAALSRLTPDLRMVAVLHYIADLTTTQVARELDIAEGTVKSRLSRARKELGRLLSDREEREHV
jgi:RNA polymerase sigma factor (sigma-70 family)